MRLLNTGTLELKEFYGDALPPYAILSHLWVDGEEISFHDFTELSPSTTTKSGFHKIQSACDIAQKDGIAWIWIDTNCIDKASSAELTEAINSMYIWYQRSTVCYAYLHDVPDHDLGQDDALKQFRESQWFRRGWTLQELIGPRRLIFYSQSWKEIGDRSKTILTNEISAITGIETSLFQGLADLHEISVAKKMSWAAKRKTTRVEDIAYCLLGLFDVNMPLLYGEGPKAFIRLQEEIIKTSNDHTIFCWTKNRSVPRNWTSMLAPSPAAFLSSGDYVTIDAWESPMPYSITNLGLSIHLPIVYTMTQMFIVLDAGLSHESPDMRACIAMQRTNQRRSGSNILDRSPYLDSPIILSKDATDTRERYNLFVRSRHHPHLESPYIYWPPIFKHGILLFVDPSATRLLSTGRGGMPLRSVGYDIETHPPGIFDFGTSLLRLPAFEGGSALLTSGLVRIRFTSPQEADFYLFFAVVSTLTGAEAWHCGVHFAEEFDFIKLAVQEDLGDGGGGGGACSGDVPPEDVLIHSYLRSEAWENRCKTLSAHTADESLFVAIGGSVASGRGTDVRAAVLSGKWDAPYPVPLSLTESGESADEDEDDADYVDVSEGDEGEDWDSDSDSEEMRAVYSAENSQSWPSKR
ncbi:HET-domain-containing protein [Whalleya microplaca]|nr:HET-domain-containing protein [Whalleya microplaca]